MTVSTFLLSITVLHVLFQFVLVFPEIILLQNVPLKTTISAFLCTLQSPKIWKMYLFIIETSVSFYRLWFLGRTSPLTKFAFQLYLTRILQYVLTSGFFTRKKAKTKFVKVLTTALAFLILKTISAISPKSFTAMSKKALLFAGFYS